MSPPAGMLEVFVSQPVVNVEDIKELILDALNLREDMKAEEMDPDVALFGKAGLGLDSLDALQLAVALEERYQVAVDEKLGADVFRSVRAIAEHVNRSRAG